MPKSIGGIIGFAVASLVATAIGIFILSRVGPAWRIIYKAQA